MDGRVLSVFGALANLAREVIVLPGFGHQNAPRSRPQPVSGLVDVDPFGK